jgi:hypothetical protein
MFGTWILLIEVPENGDGASVQDASRWGLATGLDSYFLFN